MVDSVKEDRTDFDVAYEIMIKMGIPLDTVVSEISINDKKAYSVGDNLLVICLAENITPEDIEKMAEYNPVHIVCAEKSFADGSALSNAHYILRDLSVGLKLV